MIFTEPRFFFFFAAAFVGYWSLRSNTWRKFGLLVASYVFYAAWDWRFLSLILISTAVDYLAGLRVAAAADPRIRRGWLLLSLGTNLSILGFFKYFNFFVDSAVALLAWAGVEASHRQLSIVLPVGISFYTFQTLSYTIDIYRRRLKPTRNLIDWSLFVAFFPQLVAGPIVRAHSFLPQLRIVKCFEDVRVRRYLTLFLAGLIKKACISDNIAPLVDQVFNRPAAYDSASIWLATVLYAVQIYCDFSGYSDMAIACAGLLGYDLGQNFYFPYFSTNIGTFWRRWHMSLSSWLRDYLYIELGGNRHSQAKTYRNLMITMLLGGLWHGAAWTFVVWGGFHGAALAAQRVLSEVARLPRMGQLGGPLGWAATMYWVLLTWIFFRASTLGDALIMARGFVLFDAQGSRTLELNTWLLVGGLLVVHAVVYGKWLAGFWERLPTWGFAIAYGVAVALVVPFVPLDAEPFIYFQF